MVFLHIHDNLLLLLAACNARLVDAWRRVRVDLKMCLYRAPGARRKTRLHLDLAKTKGGQFLVLAMLR